MRNLLGIISLVLVVAGLTACGSSDSDSTATTASQSASGSSQGSSTTQSQSSTQTKSTQAKQGSQHSQSHSDPQNVATPLKVSGGGSAQFREPGGDNSVPDYGEESSEDELRAAAEAIHAFYIMRAEGRWAKACSYLAASVVRQLEGLGEQASHLKDTSCPSVLKTFTKELPPAAARETTIVDAASLRNGDERSFLIYYGAKHAPYAMSLVNEDGEWKLALIAGTPLG